MLVSIIAAMGKNRVIGKNNALPWNLPEDLEHFKKLTLGKPVIMGQRTFESIGKPLAERKNIILTKDNNFQPLGCIAVRSIGDALTVADDAKEVMIAGGASVYSQFLPLADRMYLTLIKGEFEGDAFFPEFDWSDWREIERENHDKYSFITLEKIK